MKWTTTVVDIQPTDHPSKYLALVGADKDHFCASTVIVIDLEAPELFVRLEVPITPFCWTSMVKDCAGYDLLLTGAEYMHHTWSNGTLQAHPQNIGHRSGRLWKSSDEVSFYCAKEKIISVTSSTTRTEIIKNMPSLTYLTGLSPMLEVLAGDDGYISVNHGLGWLSIDDVPTLSNFVDINCVTDREIYFAAGYGGLFRWNGGSDWYKYETDPSAFMYSLCLYKGQMCAASLHLKSYWLTEFGAVPMHEAKVATKFRTDGEFLFGLGAYGKFEVFDGTNWRIYELDLYKLFPMELEAMYAAAPTP